jgi:hypothetical protein
MHSNALAIRDSDAQDARVRALSIPDGMVGDGGFGGDGIV